MGANFKYEKKYWRKGFKFVAGLDEVGRGCFAGPVVAGCVIFDEGVLSRNSPKSTHMGVTPALGLPIARHPLNENPPRLVPPLSTPRYLWVAGAEGVPLSARSVSEESRTGRAPDRTHMFEWQDPASLGVIIDDSKKLTPRQREIADKWIRENASAFGLGLASVTQINRLGIKKATEIAFRKAISKVKPDFLLIDAFYIPYVKGLRRGSQKAVIKGDAKSISIAAASIIAKVYRDKLMLKLSKQSKYQKYGWEKNKGYGTAGHQKAIKKYGTTRQHRRQFVETFLRNSKNQITKNKQI